MRNNLFRLFAALMLVLPLGVASQESDPIEVVIAPLEILGVAEPEFAKLLLQKLLLAVEADSGFAVVADGAAPYLIKGQIYAEPERQFVGLQLVDTRTGSTLWSENYDYVGITADMMATDLLRGLQDVLPKGH